MIFLLAQESKSHYNSIPYEKVVLINIHYDAYDTDTAFYSINMFEIHLLSGHSSEHRRGEKVYRKTHLIICNYIYARICFIPFCGEGTSDTSKHFGLWGECP